MLKDRAALLGKARSFFAEKGILEVDCPQLSTSASVDAHIDLISAFPFDGLRFLHSSPEYGMKRLLSLGMGDIYQLSHVFRNEECGSKHNPEFMMAEWYRLGITFAQMIEETLDFVRLFLGDLPSSTISYRDAFIGFAGFDYVKMTPADLLKYLQSKAIEIDSSLDVNDKDTLLNLIMGTIIEPQLGKNELCALAYYPSSQAALARTIQEGDQRVAERFEVYYNGVELANGYHELVDCNEQRNRLDDANLERMRLDKTPLPIDENFLEALEHGLPDCCGVAVGFDRLMMLRHGKREIGDVIPFAWKEA